MNKCFVLVYINKIPCRAQTGGVSTFGSDPMSIDGWVPVKNFHENQKYIGTFGPPFFLLFAKNPEILLFLSLLFWIFKNIFENFCDFFEKILSVK